jgi:hypothetical protein
MTETTNETTPAEPTEQPAETTTEQPAEQPAEPAVEQPRSSQWNDPYWQWWAARG